MDYSNYPERVKSAKEWLAEYEKYIIELKTFHDYSPEQIEEYKNNFFALEILAEKNVSARKRYADNHNTDVEEIMELRPVVEEIIEMFQQQGDRNRYLEHISILSMEAIIKICQRRLGAVAGAKLIPSVVATTDEIFAITENDPSGRFEIDDTGLINVDEITYKYPKTIKIVRDLTTQAVFKKSMKNGFDENGVLSHKSKNGKDLVVIRTDNNQDLKGAEEELSYFDWAVMEAIYSLFLAENTNMTLDSISRVMKHSNAKTASGVQKENWGETQLYKSIQKLCRIYIRISDESCDFHEEGNIIDGKLLTDHASGKLYLHIDSVPILCKHADKLNHINTYSFDELELHLNYNDYVISIYRFLIAEILARFGTIKVGEKINGTNRTKKRLNSPILLRKICMDILGERNPSKEQTIRKRIPAVLDEMIRLDFISSYKINGSGINTSYDVFRD